MSAGCPVMMLQPPALATTSTPASPTLKRKQLTLPGITVPPLPNTSTITQVQRSRSQCNAASNVKTNVKAPRRKLGPGCGLLDWIRLCRSKKDLAGNGGKPRPVSEEELAQHNTPDDAWTAIRGKVYNLTPYMKFHPGGKEDLMKGAGKDCTILFDEVHKWVNIESMMKACYVGPLETLAPSQVGTRSPAMSRHRSGSLMVAKPIRIPDGANTPAVNTTKTSMELRNETQAADACEEPDGVRQVSPESPSKPLIHEIPGKLSERKDKQAAEDAAVTLIVPTIRTRKNSDASKPNPRFDWVQSEKYIVIHAITHCPTLKTSDVVVDVNGKTFEAAIFINDWVYELKIALAHSVVSSQVNITAAHGRVEISLRKEAHQEQWENIGTHLYGNQQVVPKNKRDPKYRFCSVESIKTVTHDTKQFTLRLNPGSYLQVPTGHHVSIRADVDGEEIEREYTPVTALPQSSNRQQLPQTQQPSMTSDSIEMMIKLYKDGKMSRYLETLRIGDQVLVSDPQGTFDAARLVHTNNILLVAAGSGFTPMARVLHDAVCSHNHCKTRLLFANKTEEDILWKDELDHLSKTSQGRFEVAHVLSAANGSWGGVKGRINGSLLKAHLPNVSSTDNHSRSLVCVCGPTPFTTAISNLLLDMEFPDEYIHCFT